MRVLQVFDVFSPHTNGTTKLLYQLAKFLRQRGHEVTIYCSDFRIEQEYIDSLGGVKVHPFRSWLNQSSPSGFHIMPGMVRQARQELQSFDIIHQHSYRNFANIVIHYYAGKYGIPYVIDAHGSMLRVGKRRLKWFFDVIIGNRLLRDSSRVIAETDVGIAEYKEAGVAPDKIVLLPPPPCDVEEFARLPPSGLFRQKFNIQEKHIIMFLGRIHWVKGLDFLVESFYELAQNRNDVILVIVGPDDGYKSTLEGLIGKLKSSDKVLFTGFLGGDDKLAALGDASVVIQTSRYEQGAGAPIEAVLCGTPIIVTRHTGAGEDVARLDAGYLVEFGNKKELVELISAILENPTPGRAKARQAAAYIRQNMSMTKRIEDYEKLYLECIEANKQLVRGAK